MKAAWHSLSTALRYGLRSSAVRVAAYASMAAFASCLLMVLLWWSPAWHEYRQWERQIDVHRAALVQFQKSRQTAQAQRQVLPSLALQEKKLQTRATQADLIQGIAGLAAKRNVRVISRAFEEGKQQPEQEAARVQPLYLDLGLAGAYPDIRRLGGDLATLPQWIEIVEEQIETTGTTQTAVKAQMRLLILRPVEEARS